MNKVSYTKRALALMTSVMLTVSAPVVLADDEDLQDQLSSVQSQMAEQAQKKSEAEAVIGNVYEKLRVIQENLDAAKAAYESISSQIGETDKKIADTQSELEKAQAHLSKREVVLSRRIRDIYMNGKLNYLDVIIGAKDFNDFATRVELLRRVVNSDLELISSIREERDKIDEAKKILEEERQRLATLQTEAEAKKTEIEQHKAEQQAILRKAETDKATAEEAYAELEASSNQIAQMLREREAARQAAQAAAASGGSSGGGDDDSSYQPVSGSGQMIWPVNGVDRKSVV